MTDVILAEQEIEPGRTEDAVALFEEIGRVRDADDVMSALEREGVHTESAFLRRTDEADYVLYYIEAEDGEQVYDVYRDIVTDPEGEAEGLAEFVREFNDVMAGEPSVVEADLLYHLVTPDRP
ncbi:DUF6176 family protein [Halomarina pelagica]|uniref:DUF6176 family protein n=1 Tax=Halomarina pelagica TaxID=2961599 RepID=UPI0020C48748|nr:DUF6176 family protein [Halomarina sp. BND7]